MYQWNCFVDIKRSILDNNLRAQSLVEQLPVHSQGISVSHGSGGSLNAETATYVCNWSYWRNNSGLTVYKSLTLDDQHISQSVAHLTMLWPPSLSSQLCSPVQAIDSIWCPLCMRNELISVGAMNKFGAENTPYWCFHCVYVTWGSVMLMSSAFPRNGMRRGPGGSGSLVNFALDVQTDKKATRETAPVTITMVSIPQMSYCSLWLHFIFSEVRLT